MSNNDNWNDFDVNTDEDFTDAWSDAGTDDFQDIEVDIPETVSVSNSDSEGETEETEDEIDIPRFNTERPVRKVTPRRDYDEEDDDEDEDDYEEKKGNGVTILIIVISLLVVGALIFLAIKLVGGSETDTGSESTTEASAEATTVAWELNANPEVVSLVNSYYAARTLVDTYTLKSLVDSSITIDETALANEAAVVEGYQDITCYISDGKVEGEWACYVSYAIKFKNIATPAPGFVAHYIKTDESGNLKLIPWEYVQKDSEIFDFIADISDCDAIVSLAAEVAENYRKALESDTDLYTYIVGITGTEVPSTEQPSGPFSTEPASTEAPTTSAPETTAPTTSSSEGETNFTDVDTMMYVTKDKVNVRKKATTESDVIGSLMKGDYIQITGKGSEWYRICTKDGKTGYVKKDFFSNNKPAAATTAAPEAN